MSLFNNAGLAGSGLLVTDRTGTDVEQARQLIKRIAAGKATADDIALWNKVSLKGSYDYTDLNRVTEAMEYLRQVLSDNGYQPPGYAPVRVRNAEDGRDPHTWFEDDMPTPETMNGYLNNVAAIRKALALVKSTPDVPATMENLTPKAANDIEKILLAVEVSINAMLDIKPKVAQSLMFCGFAVYPKQRVVVPPVDVWLRLYTADGLAVYTADGLEVYVKE